MNNWINRGVILKNDDCFKSPHLYTGIVHVSTKYLQITLEPLSKMITTLESALVYEGQNVYCTEVHQ